ncbi:MAG: hypothetical protein DRI95_01130 [Bacteroidetes bacterium]|nr:MAG: hypothetical protein DRI95_01130 [Bacteroidota bacterium]
MRQFIFPKKNLVLILVIHTFLFTNNIAYAGNNKYNGILTDTSEINQLLITSQKYRKSNPDTSFFLARDALKKSQLISYTKGEANSYNELAYIHLTNYNKNDSAFYFYQKAEGLYKLMEDRDGLAKVNFGLAYAYSFKGDLSKSEKYLKKSLNQFQFVGNKKGMYNCYNSLTYIYRQNKDYENAYKNIDFAIQKASELNDTSGLADGYNNKGNIYLHQALFPQAIEAFFTALNLWELKNDSAGLATAYGSLGNIYYNQNDYLNALLYFNKKIPIILKNKNYFELSKTYNNIALIYNSSNKNDTALIYLIKSLELNHLMQYKRGIANVYYKIANTFFLMAMIDSASLYVDKSINLSKIANERPRLAECYVLNGKILFLSDKISKAIESIQKGYYIAKELSMPLVVSDASEMLSKIYSEDRQYGLAYKYLLEFKKTQDKIDKNENIKKITQLEMRFEFDKEQRLSEYKNEKEKATYKAKIVQQRTFLFSLIAIIISIVSISILIIRQKNIAVKYKTIELSQKLLRAQMNPHFIFNSLAAIQDFIINNKAIVASNFLAQFAKLMRQILENSRHEFVTIENELATLKNYLDIQKLRFEEQFDYEINIDDSIDEETHAIPPMLAQPFIENAIEHGLKPMKEKGKIQISFQLIDGMIKFEVKDNGIGRAESSKTKGATNLQKISLATTLTQERLKYLKSNNKKDIRFKIDDLTDEVKPIGTCVTFYIPGKKIYN